VSGKYGDLKPMKTKPGNYDLVVIVTPFWAGKIPPIVRTYLRDNKDSIKKIALLSVSGSGQKNLNTALPDFEKRAGKKSNSTLLLSEQEFATYKENLSGFVERLSRK
jgi:hypothetical protein